MSGRPHKTHNFSDHHADLIFFIVTVTLAVILVKIIESMF